MPDNPLTADDVRQIFREELATHQERIGHPAETAEHREALRADADFVRAWRKRIDKGAETIGKIVLTALAGVIIAIFAAGAKLYFRQLN